LGPEDYYSASRIPGRIDTHFTFELIHQKQPKGEQQVQWNAEGLPAGMYYYRIQAGDKIGGGKMVKME